jgi:membrane-bound serine protease (ClpP class)
MKLVIRALAPLLWSGVILTGSPARAAPASGTIDAARKPGPAIKAPAKENAIAVKPAAAEKPEAQTQKRVGRLFKIVLPITGRTTERLRQPVLKAIEKAQAENVRPVLIFEFSVTKGQSEYGRGSLIGNAYDLADFLSSGSLNAATTVAYVPQSIQGHAVLATLACDAIVMAPDAELGPAGIDEQAITDTIRTSYTEIAGRRKKVPVEVALKLVDSSRELVEVETDVGTEYATPEGLAGLAKRRTIGAKTIVLAAGQPGRFSGTEARRRGFINYLASNRVEMARAMEVPPETVQEDVLLEGVFHAVRVDVKGPIRADLVDKTKRVIQDAISRQEADFICLRIESAGGSPKDSIDLAGYLLDRDPSKVRTVAYIAKEARCDAAIIALACDQIVMHPKSVLGGEGDYTFSRDEIRQMRDALRGDLAARKSRSWSLPAAMFDPELAVFRCARKGDTAYFSDAELAEQRRPAEWTAGERVTTPGRPFLTSGNDAVTYHLANHVVDDAAQFRELYGLENDPALLEPRWADTLIDALASPGIAILLLIVGGVALYVEMHTPGLGIAAFVALICFALFFWSRFLGGTAGWLEVILFVAGISCIALEAFVLPGFGVFGLGGGAMVLASLVLASQTFLLPRNSYQVAEFQNSLLVLAAATVGIVVAVATVNRWLPQTPLLGQMVLEPPSEEEAAAISDSEALAHFEDMVGAVGSTTTPLLPSGKAQFKDELLDVISDGEFIPRDTEIVVVDVRGNRIVVRARREQG